MKRATSAVLALSLFGCGGDDSPGNAGGAGGIGTGGTATGGTGGGAGAPSGGTGGSGGATGGSAGASGGTGGAPSGCTPKSSGYVTDLGAHPEPALPALPSAGSSVVDPSFGTRIVRLTDSTHGSECVTAYSYWPTFNATSTRLFVNCAASGPRLFDFEPGAGAASNERPLFAKPTPAGSTPNWEDAIWSDTEPDVLFAHDTVRLWRYDVVLESYTLVKDFSGSVGGGHVRQMSKSKGDGVFGFTTQDASWGVTGCLAWRASDDKLLLEESQPGLDEVQVDKSGKWLVIKTGKSGTGVVEVRVASLDTGAIVDLVDDGPDYSPGHSDNGTGTVIGADNWTNRVTFRKLDTPHTLSSVLELGGDWTQDFHVSMRADDESRVLLSLYQSDVHTTGLFHNEIVQVATDGSASVRRLAHHRSVVGQYFDSPRANISRDGCFVAFTSTWGQSGRRDVFLLDLSE